MTPYWSRVEHRVTMLLWRHLDVPAVLRPTDVEHRAFVERAEAELKAWTTNWKEPQSDDLRTIENAYLDDLLKETNRLRAAFVLDLARAGNREGLNPRMGCV